MCKVGAKGDMVVEEIRFVKTKTSILYGSKKKMP